MSSVKIVLIKTKIENSHGYLKVRIIKNRKPKYQSLKIKVNENNWNQQKQKVTSGDSEFKIKNDKIQDVLTTLAKHDSQISAISNSSVTILNYYDDLILTTINEGTRLKYKGIRDKFEKYLKSEGELDLYFHELNELHVKKFLKYIRDNGCATNTANYQLKSFKSLVNKAISAGVVSYANNPFATTKLRFDKNQKEALSLDELIKLIDKEVFVDSRNENWHGFKKNRRFVSLEELRDIFLFQFNMQGMRCSDMQLLRWNNFKVVEGLLVCNYVMRKTGKEMTITVTPFALQNMRYSIYDIVPQLEKDVQELENQKKLILQAIKELDKEKDSSKVDALEIVFTDVSAKIYKTLATAVFHFLNENIHKNNFTFPFLNHDDFKMYDNKQITNLNSVQYKRLTGTRHYYNRLLKEIQKECNIYTNLTSHVARHSYTTLLIENNASITELSATLGHKHISTTQTYISRLNLNNISNLNTMISKMFYK
jgi:site-specific recombinase XerD